MKSFLRYAKLDIPVSMAVPWIVLALLSPLWGVYVFRLAAALAVAARSLSSGSQLPSPHAVENDFLVFWPVAKAIVHGKVSRIYDEVWLSNWQRQVFHFAVSKHLQFFYPPGVLLLLLAIVPFHFFPGLLLWLILLAGVGVVCLRYVKAPWIVVILGIASPAFLFNAMCAQLDFVTGCVFIAGLFAADRPTNTAGVLLGLITIKPQAGLIGPIVLLARGRIGALCLGALTFAFLCTAATWMFGWRIWPAYVQQGLATSHHILVRPFPTSNEVAGASVFWMARSLGATATIAGKAQAASALGAVIWCWVAWRRPAADRVALVALTVALTLLVTPYAYTTDMCGFSVMIVWLAWARRRLEVADVLMWLWPVLCPVVSMLLHMELTPLILLLGAVRAWKRLDGIGTRAPACYLAPI